LGFLKVEILTCADGLELAEKAAQLVVSTAVAAVRDRGCFHFCLAGGRTPVRLYQRLAEWSGPESMPWERTEIFWGDERAVPRDHPDSNYAMAFEGLLKKISLAPQQIHAMPGTAVPLGRGAEDYEKTLRRFFRTPEVRTFDLIVLGLGTDGHTASLFPGSLALEETERMVLAVAAPDGVSPATDRLTLTLPAINASGVAVFLAAGREKQQVVREIFGGEDRRRLPAGRVKARERTVWLLDQGVVGGMFENEKVVPAASDAVPGTCQP